MATDPRAVVEYRVPATALHTGDLVNTGDGDWQEVRAVITGPGDTSDANLRELARAVGDRYVVVQLTDVTPLDSEVYFAEGTAMTYSTDGSEDRELSEVVSADDGSRIYLYTRYEVVTVRGSA
jgi:hypothetical protein